MKKYLIPTTVFIVIAVIAASLFAEDAAKPEPAKRPERPSVRTPRTRGEMPQRAGSMEAMIQQQATRIKAEITRLQKTHQAEIDQLNAILKQAKEEKASKTAAMLNDMIKKKNTENTERVNQVQKRADEFKKRMQQGPRKAAPTATPKDKSARENMPIRKPRTRTNTTPTNK